MMERPFMDHNKAPNDASIANVLNDVYTFYKELRETADQFRQEWNYSNLSGWMLKVFDADKALFYLIPLNNEFKITLTLRENERESLLQNQVVQFAFDDMQNSKKHAEGFAIQFQVIDTASSSNCQTFIGEIIKLRKT